MPEKAVIAKIIETEKSKKRRKVGKNMAENIETTTVETENSAVETEGGTPTVEELMAELAKERAEKAKLKTSFDTTSSELATAKRQLRTKMTAEEQEAEAKKAADEAKDARIQELESKFRTMDYSKRYMGIGMDEKTAESLSELTGELSDPDKFFSALDKFMKAKVKSAGDEAVQKLIKENNLEVKAGSGEADKNAWVADLAKDIAHQKSGANTNILEKYL